jgi:hypothetical protein
MDARRRPGAIGAFRREALLRVGGVGDDTLAEDSDLTMSLSRDGRRVVYKEDARAWTEAPASLGALWKQRYHWCYGTLQAMWKHRGAAPDGEVRQSARRPDWPGPGLGRPEAGYGVLGLGTPFPTRIHRVRGLHFQDQRRVSLSGGLGVPLADVA